MGLKGRWKTNSHDRTYRQPGLLEEEYKRPEHDYGNMLIRVFPAAMTELYV
jgi:hypothetical protein